MLGQRCQTGSRSRTMRRLPRRLFGALPIPFFLLVLLFGGITVMLGLFVTELLHSSFWGAVEKGDSVGTVTTVVVPSQHVHTPLPSTRNEQIEEKNYFQIQWNGQNESNCGKVKEEEEEGGGKNIGSAEARIHGYRLRKDVCLVLGEQSLLQVKQTRGTNGENQKLNKTVSAYVIHIGCDVLSVRQEIARFFTFQVLQRDSLNQMKNERFSAFRPQVLILAGRCQSNGDDTKTSIHFDRRDLLHWIRVATGHFILQKWWMDEETTTPTTNTFLMISLDGSVLPGRGKERESIMSQTSGSPCLDYLWDGKENSSEWFPMESIAHKFRLRWIQYIHYYYSHLLNQDDLKDSPSHDPAKTWSQTDAALSGTLVSLWGEQPYPPVFRRMVIAAFDKPQTNHSPFPPSFNVSAVMTVSESFKKERPPRITILVQHGKQSYDDDKRNFDEKEMARYLHEKFGGVGHIQLLHLSHEVNPHPTHDRLNESFELYETHEPLEVFRQLALTDVLIASHGSALSRMMMMQPGSVLVELFPRGCRGLAFLQLAAALRVSYRSYEDGSPNMTEALCTWPLLGSQTATSAMHSRPLHSVNYDGVRVSKLRLYHLVKSGLSAVWLRNSRFTHVMEFDRR